MKKNIRKDIAELNSKVDTLALELSELKSTLYTIHETVSGISELKSIMQTVMKDIQNSKLRISLTDNLAKNSKSSYSWNVSCREFTMSKH